MTVYDNLGPDHYLAGPKALDPPYLQTIKPFDCKSFVLKSQLCGVMSCSLFWPRHPPYSY